MKKMKSFSFVIAIVLFFSCGDLSEKKAVQFENSEFSKSFICNSNNPGGIQAAYYGKKDGTLLNQTDAPYFEFMVNGKPTTSNDKLWVFRDMKERQMKNGGTEYTLVFSGARKHVQGLSVCIVQQVFPGSSLVREKLILYASEDTFRLNKNQGELHLRFPQYAIHTGPGDDLESVEIKMASWEKKSRNHMYFTDIQTVPVRSDRTVYKGPIHILNSNALSWITAYEHASQDNIEGLLNKEKTGAGNLINDAMQGTKGVFNFPLKDEDFKFLGICTQKAEDLVSISVDALRGAYLDGEQIDADHPYETVWTATAFYEDKDLDKGREIIRNYLFHQICENPVSREPEFYYNTWGMQREDKSRPLRGILTYERIFEEIDYAAQLGVDIFVLDDGWEQTQGDWTPHKERLPDGLGPIKEKLDEYGIKMGLWFSPMGIDSTTRRYKEHPEWVILDSEGNPIQAQWGHPAFDFVSDFSDLFIEDCKRLIDQGCRFMKWDAINTFYSSLPDLDHGSKGYAEGEIRARYEYLLPIYVVKAMEILTEYEPELVIEIDLTEARRVMIGLAPLSQGKLFFMNNGASSYNDYSGFRTKSLRTIASEFAGEIPLELFTYASYPHDLAGFMEYNVNNSLLAGHGFWGDLSLMSGEQRAFVGQQVRQSKRVLPYISESLPVVVGKVGDSPEIYAIINREKGAGQIISFSEEPSDYRFEQNLNTSQLLAVLNNPYDAREDLLQMDLIYAKKESTSAIFVLPNEGTGISIVSSTVSISDARSDGNQLSYQVDGAGTQLIRWALELGEPVLKDKDSADICSERKEDWFLVKIQVRRDKRTKILLAS
jgi:hypothetical protein